MGACVSCGAKQGMEIESIFANGKSAALINFGRNYCAECAGKRIEELRRILQKRKNILSLASELKLWEEMRIIEV